LPQSFLAIEEMTVSAEDDLVEAHRKQDIALRLSLAGASASEIAASRDPETGQPLYGSAAGAGKALKAARERSGEVPPKKIDVVDTEVQRLDRLQRALWPAAMSGDVAASREIRMLVMARAALRGVAKGLPDEETPDAGDPVNELERKRAARRAASR
jgi:hypothetical protein